MFLQVMRGKVADEAALWAALERWEQELRPGAGGFLGSTAGATTGGEFLVAVRFADEESARANSARAEQGAWWEEFARGFDGDVRFDESADASLSMGGGSDDAGFVQVMYGEGDRDRAEQLLTGAEELLRRERPDIIGGCSAWLPDGRFVDITYFTSEEEARAGESREPSDETRSMFEEFNQVMRVEEYLDIPAPRFT